VTGCWLLGLDPDYRWAVAGNPNRKDLWLLSRTPQLPPALLDIFIAVHNGYVFCRIGCNCYSSNAEVSTPG